MPKINPDKPPALRAVKKLTFRRSPSLKAEVIKVGVEVQRELEKESRMRTRSIDNVLRAIVRRASR
jgi:hypothetical protein